MLSALIKFRLALIQEIRENVYLTAGNIFVNGKKLRGAKKFADTKQLARLIKIGTYMQLKKQLKQNLSLALFGTLLLALHPVNAETDFASQERLLKARVKSYEEKTDHSAHLKPVEKHLEFHGVFYGFLPCEDCNGIKTTLSLKQNNNYLLVTQPARDSSREYYEKGKYTWDDKNQLVVLTPRKESTTKQYYIQDEGTIVQLNSDGKRVTGDDADDYILRRSDTVKSREVHIH